MKKDEHHNTDDFDKVSFFGKVSYGMGMLGFAPLRQIFVPLYNSVFKDTMELSTVL